MQTKLVLQTQLAAFTALALISGTALAHDSRSHAADSSDDYRGAGGPFLGCGLRGADGVPTYQEALWACDAALQVFPDDREFEKLAQRLRRKTVIPGPSGSDS